jgi:hypothetical protein
MFNIEQFLKKFSKTVFSNELYKKQIIEIIKRYTNVDITEENIEIKNNIIYTTTNPGVKNKLFIYKNKILEDISSLPIKIIDIK